MSDDKFVKDDNNSLSSLFSTSDRPLNKVTIVGCGIIGALEAYFAFKQAQKNGQKLRITMVEAKGPGDTPACHIAPSLTPDEIMAVVPQAPVLIEKLGILFSEPGGIRVDDVPNVNHSAVKDDFIGQLQEYNKDPAAHAARSKSLLKLGKVSMDMWQKIYDEADIDLKLILEESNFQPCKEIDNETKSLHAGYRIDLISNIQNAGSKAKEMSDSYASIGYEQCKILSPEEVKQLDPYLSHFCDIHTTVDKTGNVVWHNDTAALFRPGGCLDAETFLPKLYDYLAEKMGTYKNQYGIEKSCFRQKFNRPVTGVVFKEGEDRLSVSGLVSNEKTKTNTSYEHSDYVFCPGEKVGTLKKLGFAEPAYSGFAGVSLKLKIPLPYDKIESYANFNHCMEVHREGVVLAWQARYNKGKIAISVAGTKSFYGDQTPNKFQDFACNRNLLQLNMINDVLPEFITMALQRDTKGKILCETDLLELENKGIATRWAGVRGVAFDGYITAGPVFRNGRKVENARTTTHMGSGGVSFGPASVLYSRSALNNNESDDVHVQEVMKYAKSNRTSKQ